MNAHRLGRFCRSTTRQPHTVAADCCRVVADPQYTRYFFGPLSDIAGKDLQLMERNAQGDCLCLVEDKGLVDVDSRDVEAVHVATEHPASAIGVDGFDDLASTLVMDMLKNVTHLATRMNTARQAACCASSAD